MHLAVNFCPKFSLGCFVIALAAIPRILFGRFADSLVTPQWKMFKYDGTF